MALITENPYMVQEIGVVVNNMRGLAQQLVEEGKIPIADRLLSTDNVDKINDNIGAFSDYLTSLIPAPLT